MMNQSIRSNEELEDLISPDFCRLCLLKSTILKSMFHCSIGPQTYAEIYKECTGYCVIENDELPNRICNECESKLISFHNFRLSIEKVEERLELHQAQTNYAFNNIEEEKLEQIYEIKMSEEDNVNNDIDDENEEFIIEQVYEDEEILEDHFVYNEEEPLEESMTSTICRFTQSTRNTKHVECTTCTEGCETEKSINEMKQDEHLSLTCECGKILKNRRSFLKHYTTIHQRTEGNFPCRKCQETFHTWRLRVAHEANVHSVGLKFTCSSCSKKFYRSDHWKEHEKVCNRIDDPLQKFFSCPVCLFTFQREETYKKHLETAHPGASESDKECTKKAEEYSKRYSKSRNDLNETNDTPSIKSKPICTICNKIFKNDLGLQKHTSLFHTDQVWSCDKCDAVFVHRSTKISHMCKEHGLKKPFECSFPSCAFSCFKKDRFNAHVQKHEDPDKKFPCPICQQEFKSYNTMTLHRARHLTKNTYVCATCSKQFLDKRNYKVHVKLHTGEDLHYCSVCLRGFNRKDHLQKHQERKKHFDINTDDRI